MHTAYEYTGTHTHSHTIYMVNCYVASAVVCVCNNSTQRKSTWDSRLNRKYIWTTRDRVSVYAQRNTRCVPCIISLYRINMIRICGRQKKNQETHDQLIIDFSIQLDLYLSLPLSSTFVLSLFSSISCIVFYVPFVSSHTYITPCMRIIFLSFSWYPLAFQFHVLHVYAAILHWSISIRLLSYQQL